MSPALSYNVPEMAIKNKRAGQQMKELRDALALTMREVHVVTKEIAKGMRNPDYTVSPSRLSDIEDKGRTPNLYRLHALALTYKRNVRKLLMFYNIK